jgi:2,5-diketo-D-gluconate reductase A
VMLRWHVENGLCVIPKSSSRDRQAENLDVFDLTLDADDLAGIAQLDSADGRIGPDPDTF